MKDIAGQRFGKLTAIKPFEQAKNGAWKWLCKCDCGKECISRSSQLLAGKKNTCGCYFHKDLTGKRFNSLLVVKRTEEKKYNSYIYECLCDCGKRTFVPAQNLKQGQVSCGCSRINDITGQRFGKLTAIELHSTRNRRAYWKCKCECGEEKIAPAARLKSGDILTCGCHSDIKDISGQRFGKLVALELSHTTKNGAYWKCKCDCGKTKTILGASLRFRTNSCGCERFHTHGKSSHYIYKTWKGMKGRCIFAKPGTETHRNYKGRGISIHKDWINDFQCFYDYVIENLGERPEGFSLDRIDNDGNYEPGNIRWADRATQQNNKRNSKRRSKSKKI